MLRLLSSARTERAQATLELVVVLIILVPLFFGAIELTRMVSLRHSLDSGAYSAVRAIALNPADLTYPGTLVTRAVNSNIFGSSGASNLNPGSIRWLDCPEGQVLGCTFEFRASVDYDPWLPFIGGSPVTITVTHFGIIERIY